MNKIILAIIAASCFSSFSFAKYMVFIDGNYQIQGNSELPTVPELTPGGCDGTGIIKIKLKDGVTFDDSVIADTNGMILLGNYDNFITKNNCWGNSKDNEVETIWVSGNLPPKKSAFNGVKQEKWNNADTLYLRFIAGDAKLPVLKAIYIDDLNTYRMFGLDGTLNDTGEWRQYVYDNKLTEYEIQVSEIPYN